MSQVWTADNIVLTKTEFDIPNGGGNKAVSFGFTSDILADGVLHHKYNEPNIGVNPAVSMEEHARRIIQNHLAVWDVAGKIISGLPLAAVGLPDPPAPPTPAEVEKTAWLALRAEWQRQVKVLASGMSKVVTDQTVAAAYDAMKQDYKEEYGAFVG